MRRAFCDGCPFAPRCQLYEERRGWEVLYEEEAGARRIVVYRYAREGEAVYGVHHRPKGAPCWGLDCWGTSVPLDH